MANPSEPSAVPLPTSVPPPRASSISSQTPPSSSSSSLSRVSSVGGPPKRPPPPVPSHHHRASTASVPAVLPFGLQNPTTQPRPKRSRDVSYTAEPEALVGGDDDDSKLGGATEETAEEVVTEEEEGEEDDPMALTPLRAHYLKRELVTLQFSKELYELATPDALSLIGPPFLPKDRFVNGVPTAPPTGQPRSSQESQNEEEEDSSADLPFSRFIFNHFILTFPFLSSCPPNLFSHKLQPFAHSFFSRNFSGTEDRDEETSRRKIAGKLEKHFGLVMSAAVRLSENEGREEVVRVVGDGGTAADPQINSVASPASGIHEPQQENSSGGGEEKRRLRRTTSTHSGRPLYHEGPVPIHHPGMPTLLSAPNTATPQKEKEFEVNVVTVRHIATKGRVRTKRHEEFVIRTKGRDIGEVYVSRRYGDFVKLAEELRTEFPEVGVPGPPAKDRRAVQARDAYSAPSSPATRTRFNSFDDDVPPLPSIPGAIPMGDVARMPRTSTMSSMGSDDGSPLPSASALGGHGSPPGSAGRLSFAQQQAQAGASSSAPRPPGQNGPLPTLARERNRLTLRAYLHSLLNNPALASSDTMRSFLLDGPTKLTSSEREDVSAREEMDLIREAEQKQFRAEVERRVRELEASLRKFREELVQRDGLSRVFATIRQTPKLQDLPPEYRKVMEWARISLASTIYQLFLGSDNSSSTLAQLKRIHGMIPYFMLRGILKISNPVAMIRSALDLFLARPFGQTSLLQRIFSSSLNEEVRELKEDIDKVAEKVADPRLVQKVTSFVHAPKEIQQIYKMDAQSDNVDIMDVILHSPENPQLDRPAFQRIARASKAYDEYKKERDALSDSDDDEGPTTEDGWLFEDLHVIMRLATRLRDKEQMIELIFEGTTSELLKDIITMFYQPLAKVYKAANIADSLYDFQAFINDLIKTVEQAEEASLSDPQRTVQTFADLVARHEGSFYHFVHQVHSKGEGLFDDLMKWIELFINFVRDGLPDPVSLEFLLPHSGQERLDVLEEVDAIIEYHRKLKIAHHKRMARRLMKSGGVTEQDEEAAFVSGVMNNLHIGAVVGDVEDVQAAVEDESSSDDEESYSSAEESLPNSPTNGEAPRSPIPDGTAWSPPPSRPPPPPPKSPSSSSRPIPPPIDTQSASDPSSHLQPSAHPISSGPTPTQPYRSTGKKKKDREPIVAPTLKHLPEMTPIFVEMMRPSLDTAQRKMMSSRGPIRQ